MTQPPLSAKRMRSNTSSTDFTNSAPQTTAPALRQSNSNANIGLYVAPTGFNGTFGPTSQVTLRQNLNYAPYGTTGQPNAYPDGFVASPTAYTDSYDPHGHPNSYAAAYGQPTSNGQNSPLTATYTQSTVSNAHNGPYVHLGCQSGSAGPASYSPVPSPVPLNSQNTNYGEIQGRSATPVSRQSFSQYGETYSSQPSAHNPQYHGQAASYPEPTVNPQYSPPLDQPVGNVNQQSPDIPPDGDNGEEDALGEEVDEAVDVYPNPTPTVEEEPPKPPDTKCACKKGRGKKKACMNCACSKYGRKCGRHCSCGDACGNPFQDLTTFFGPPEKFPKPCEANACFVTWLSNQPNIEELDMDLMVDMLLYDDKSWATIKGHTKPFREWEDRWLKAKNAKSKKVREGREQLEFDLLRGALGNCNADDFHGYWYSFCQRQWVHMDHWEHCRECKMCAPSSEWHCEQHGRCTTNRTCAGCAGAATYPDMANYVAS